MGIDERKVDSKNEIGKVDPYAVEPIRGEGSLVVPNDPSRLYGLTTTERKVINVKLSGDDAGFIMNYDELIRHTFLVVAASSADDLKLATIKVNRLLVCNEGKLYLQFTPSASISEVSVMVMDLLANANEPTKGYAIVTADTGSIEYYDDVLEYASVNDFPAEGEHGKIYVALDTDMLYRYSDGTYVQVGGQKVFVSQDITALSGNICSALRCGDIVAKEDSTGRHSYVVSYKKVGEGLCLTYVDASCVETHSYDYVEGSWVYNSKDFFEFKEGLPSTEGASEGDALVLDAQKKPKWDKLAKDIDKDVKVYLENDYTNDSYASRTNYAEPISAEEFIKNCEYGVYTNAGTIAKVENLIAGKTFRLILIGNDHEKLAMDDTTNAKTTWQFLDMPMHNVRLGLPFNVMDWEQGTGRSWINAYLEGTNESQMRQFPSNMRGLVTAQGLLDACHTIFESLPLLFKRHIKTVRRKYYVKRNYLTVAAEGGSESPTAEMHEMACNVFHLAGTDLGTSGQSGEGSGSLYAYFNANARRIRFYNGTATSWWNASPNTGASYGWYYVSNDGSGSSHNASSYYGVAPAFCI